MMGSKVLARLADELGAGVVTRLVVTGPTYTNVNDFRAMLIS